MRRAVGSIALIIIAAAVVAAGGALLWYYGPEFLKQMTSGPQAQPSKVPGHTYTNKKGEAWALPQGTQKFQIVSSEDSWPKFIEAVIDPVDVHVGNTQKFRVVLQDRVDIVEVIAEIETDNGTTTVPLTRTSQSTITENDIKNQKYFVENGKLVINDGKKSLAINNPLLTAARAASLQKFVYEGSWVVRDTHDKYYHTIFRARNAKGEKSSVTMAWSDTCGIPLSGSWTIPYDCTISTDNDGVAYGTTTISGGYTLSLTNGTYFGWSPGYSIVITGANSKILICAGCALEQGYICVNDYDGDHYYAGLTLIGTGVCTCGGDTCYRDRGDSKFITAGGDCNNSNATIQINRNQYTDADTDYYPLNMTSSQCLSASTWSDSACSTAGSNYAKNASGTCVPVSTSMGLDCYDLNANAKPGQTAYYTAVRGSSNDSAGNTYNSYDYNCNGTADKEKTAYTSACNTSLGGACNAVPPGPCTAGSCGTSTSTTPACGGTYTVYLTTDGGDCNGCFVGSKCAIGSCTVYYGTCGWRYSLGGGLCGGTSKTSACR